MVVTFWTGCCLLALRVAMPMVKFPGVSCVSSSSSTPRMQKMALMGTHCPLAWWYWHWFEKGYTQGTIASLLNSFKSDAADNAHDSTYDPQSMTVTSMFAGDDENQWLDQVKEEFGSDLSDHEEDMIGDSRPTIKLSLDAKASLAKEMKGKDYDLEGVNSHSSKQTHRTNDWENRHDFDLISQYKEVCNGFQSK